MNANIITKAFTTVNTKLASAIEDIDNVIGYQAECWAEEKAQAWQEASNSLNRVIGMKQCPMSDFQWEFDGGDAGATARVVLSALNTAYYAAFAAYRREYVFTKDDGILPFETIGLIGTHFDQTWDARRDDVSDHRPEDADDKRTFAECMHAAARVFGYAVHIAHYLDNKWLFGFDIKGEDGKKMTIRPLKSMLAWGQTYFEDSSDERFAIFKSNPSLFNLDVPDVEECKTFMRAWLNEYTPLSDEQKKRSAHPYDTRHERIIARVGERKFGEYLYDLRQGKVYNEEKHGALLQIIACTPFFAEQVNGFKSSDLWRLHEKELAVKALEKKLTQLERAEEDKRFNDTVQEAMTNINTIMARLSDKVDEMTKVDEPKADEPKVDEPKTEQPAVSGIHGQTSYFARLNNVGRRSH